MYDSHLYSIPDNISSLAVVVVMIQRCYTQEGGGRRRGNGVSSTTITGGGGPATPTYITTETVIIHVQPDNVSTLYLIFNWNIKSKENILLLKKARQMVNVTCIVKTIRW